ncbi:Putative uncharacterized protein encoded by CACTIN-AS1, partial [Apaloderma vittatum]
PPAHPLCQRSGGEPSSPSSAVTVTLEVEPELEDPIGKLAAEAVAVGILPLAVDDLEGDVLVGRPGVEAQDGKVLVVLAGLQEVLGGRALVDEVGVEDIELVALHDLGGRVVEVVVGLVVLVPLEARVHAVEEAGLAGPVLVSPEIGLAREGHLHAELRLVCAHALLGLTEEDVIGTLGGVTYREERGGLRDRRVWGAPTCDLELLAQKQQPMRVLLSLQHVGVEGELVGAQQPRAVLPGIVVVQALLDQVLLHQKREERTGMGTVRSSARLSSVCGMMGARGCIFNAPWVAALLKERATYLSLGEAGSRLMIFFLFALHTLLLLQLVQLLAQHVLVPLAQPA